MLLAWLALALPSPTVPDSPPAATPSTAGQMYDGCARFAARTAPGAPADDVNEAICAATAALLLVSVDAETAAQEVSGGPDNRTVCPPAGDRDRDGPWLARVFTAYVDHHPSARDENADQVFQRALAEKWPCPH